MQEKKRLFQREEKLNKNQRSVIMNTDFQVAKKCKWCNSLIWKIPRKDFKDFGDFTRKEYNEIYRYARVFCDKNCEQEFLDWVALTKKYRKNKKEKQRQRDKKLAFKTKICYT